MSFADAFMMLTGLVGAGCVAYGVACAIEARRARTVPAETPEAVCASK